MRAENVEISTKVQLALAQHYNMSAEAEWAKISANIWCSCKEALDRFAHAENERPNPYPSALHVTSAKKRRKAAFSEVIQALRDEVNAQVYGRAGLDMFDLNFKEHALVDIDLEQYGRVKYSLTMLCGGTIENKSFWQAKDLNGLESWWRLDIFDVRSVPMSLLSEGSPPAAMPFAPNSGDVCFHPGGQSIYSGNTLSIDPMDYSAFSQHSQAPTAEQSR